MVEEAISIARRIVEGDTRAASKLMRDIDDQMETAWEVLRELYPETGRAYIVGITGAPGTGKSTLVDKMIDVFRREGKSVGVVAVDPSSPFSGGAILGDRIRMQRHAIDEGVFIRSLATRGCLGGLSMSAQDIVNVMDAMGKEIVLIETVGVGQDEVEIAGAANTSIVVLVPGLGDDIQAIKAGIIEIGDVFVINKCDREGADRMERDLHMVLQMSKRGERDWEPLIFKTEAISGKGILELVDGIYHHKRTLEASKDLEKKVMERTRTSFLKILETHIMRRVIKKMEQEGRLDAIIRDLVKRRIDPYSVVRKIMSQEIW